MVEKATVEKFSRPNKGAARRAKDLEYALRMILASVDHAGHPNGHWHGVCVKIARAAIWRTNLEIDAKSLDHIQRHMPPPVPLEVWHEPA